MDLLQDNQKIRKNEKTPAQKLVLTLLVISIILCIIVGIVIAYISMQGEKNLYSISISGKVVDLKNLQLMTSEDGIRYVSIQALSNQLGYRYYNGEFRIPGEGANKGYVNNNKNIVQFFTDSKKIYKTTEKSQTDYEYYTLKNTILEYEGNIYISIDDLAVALNLIVNYSETNNQTSIETPENWLAKQEENFKNKNTTISNTPENLRAMAYGYIIINKDNKYGVISLNTGEEIIGNKYLKMNFCEYTGDFIVSNTNNKFGVITKSGIAKIDLLYDSFEILNYNPLLYKVERLGKFGVIRDDGTLINEIKYESIGYPENKNEEIKYSLIIPILNENIPQSIIVCNDKKYGLIELETGKEYVACILDGIYTKEDGVFYARTEKEKEYLLEIFIETLNRLASPVE